MSTNQNNSIIDSYFMRLALEQAKKNLGSTNTNPSVGCVITKKNHLIGSGCTGVKGIPHAEHNAINSCFDNLKNSNIYVTLEPCSNFGKTPPCTNLIIKKKFKKVFFSINDPDLKSFNLSYKKFKKNNIKVNKGLCSKESNEFYKSYIKFKKDLLPYVIGKIAASKDLFTISKKKWITNDYSRGRVHLIRSKSDCIITSSSTAISDNPRLTCRINGLENKTPARVIIDKMLKTPINLKIYKDSSKYRTIVFYNKINQKKISRLKKYKIQLFRTSLDEFGNMDLKIILIKLKKLGFSRILLETGIKLSHSFLKENLIDEFKVFISNNNLGKRGNGNIKIFFNKYFKKKKNEIERVNLFGDKLITYKLK